MGEGPYAGYYGPDSALKALFRLDGAQQQAVGAEHVSDIGVYWDWNDAAFEQFAQYQHGIDGLTFQGRMQIFGVPRGF